MKNFNFYSYTIKGRRKNNEDSCLAVKLNSDNTLLAVADGMGGAAAGEIASKIAIEELQKHIQQHLNKLDEKADFKKILFEAYRKIQEAIKNQIEEVPEYQGMGTTLCVVWIYKNQYVWANLGDSRIYFLHENIIKLITKDHTYVQDFMDKHGKEVPKEIAQQYGNYIMRSLDGGKDEPDIFPLSKPHETLQKNSAFLLCSDGLIPDKLEKISTHLQQIFVSQKSLKTAANALVKFAFDKGSTDNITIVLGEYGKVKRASGKRKIPKIAIPLLLGIILFALAAFIWQKPEILPEKWNPFFKDQIWITDTLGENKTTGDEIKEDERLSYSAFPRWQSKRRKVSLAVADTIPFNEYDKPVLKYLMIFQNNGNEILKHNNPNDLKVIFDKNLGLTQNQEYTWIIYAITEQGDTIKSSTERIIDIKP